MAAENRISKGSSTSEIEIIHNSVIQALRCGDVKKLQSILFPIKYSAECCQALSTESNSGLYPLHYTLSDMAASEKMESRIEIVRTLVDSIGKDKRLQHFQLRNATNKHTALHTAAANGELDVVQLLLESLSTSDRRALIAMKDGRKKKVLEYPLSQDIHQLIAQFSESDEAHTTAHGETAENMEEHSDWVKVEPVKDDDVVIEEEGEDYQMVPWPWSPDGNIAENGAEPNYINAKSMYEQFDNLLNLVKEENSFDILIQKLKTIEGLTILHVLVKEKKEELVKKLLAVIKSCDSHWKLISHKCNQGKTALHYASCVGSPVIANLLLHHCPREKRYSLLAKFCCVGRTALHYASMYSSLEVTKRLLHHAREDDIALVNMTDNKRRRAENYAATSDLKHLLSIVETHYWKMWYKKPTTLIFYNTFDDSARKKRHGAEEERDQMVQAFEKLGISPETIANFTEDKIRERIGQAVQNDEGETSALIVVILSHGSYGRVLDANYVDIRLQNIINIMSYNELLNFAPKVRVSHIHC